MNVAKLEKGLGKHVSNVTPNKTHDITKKIKLQEYIESNQCYICSQKFHSVNCNMQGKYKGALTPTFERCTDAKSFVVLCFRLLSTAVLNLQKNQG